MNFGLVLEDKLIWLNSYIIFSIFFWPFDVVVQRRTIDFTQKVYQKPLPLRAVIPGCTVCSQQRINHDNQTLRSCYFCGTCMETKQRCFISPNNTAIKHSTMSRLNATHFQPLMYASPDNHLHGTSTASANSSFKVISMFHPKLIKYHKTINSFIKIVAIVLADTKIFFQFHYIFYNAEWL